MALPPLRRRDLAGREGGDAVAGVQQQAAIVAEARALSADLGDSAKLVVDDRARGPAYAVSTPEQRALMIRVARESGLILDPVYTGKAFAGLAAMAEGGELQGARVRFLHTGGLPGLFCARARASLGEAVSLYMAAYVEQLRGKPAPPTIKSGLHSDALLTGW